MSTENRFTRASVRPHVNHMDAVVFSMARAPLPPPRPAPSRLLAELQTAVPVEREGAGVDPPAQVTPLVASLGFSLYTKDK
jgi:hypothetical protein